MLGVDAVAPRWRTWNALEARQRLAVAAAVVGVACALVLALYRFPAQMRYLDETAAFNAAQSADDRLLAGAHAYDISRPFLLAALRILPERTTYAVETGPNVGESTPLTKLSLSGYSQYLLLPRRQVLPGDPRARYLLCYGCELGKYKYYLVTDWDEEAGLVIGHFVR